MKSKGLRYKDAGVNIGSGEKAVDRIKKMVRTTFDSSVLADIGRFGGFFALKPGEFREPVLVSSVDGVGTKLKVAFLADRHDTIGEDLVNHCVNDIFVGGARPLFFLDYIATSKIRPEVIEEILRGMVRGCKNAECALIGGEMAEMPGFYTKGEYDIAGMIVGIVEKSQIIDGSSIRKGDVLIGLPSNGLHTNGFSLARKIFFDVAKWSVKRNVPEFGCTLGEELLRIHRCYLPVISPLLNKHRIKGLSHITGGGIVGNTRRILPHGRSLSIQWKSWTVPPVFRMIQKMGRVPDSDMRKTFNLGIGLVLVTDPDSVDPILAVLKAKKESPRVIGRVV
jgi:phosphoribosylformylglycinamidine cyclo-ligase